MHNQVPMYKPVAGEHVFWASGRSVYECTIVGTVAELESSKYVAIELDGVIAVAYLTKLFRTLAEAKQEIAAIGWSVAYYRGLG